MKQNQRKNQHIIIQSSIILALLFALSGCWRNLYPNGGQAYYDNAGQQYWLARLRHKGVKIVHRGEHVRLIIAGDYLFLTGNEEVRPEATVLLKEIASLIRAYSYPMFVLVSASTDEVGSPTERHARSIRQARHVASYLWRYGVANYQIKTVGWGSTQPISDRSTVAGRVHNRRVEIEIW